MTSIGDNINAVRTRVQQAAQQSARDAADIKLLAVSKTRSIEEIAQAIACGQQSFGENYLQEACDKITALQNHAIEWHFIGPLQSNKTRAAAQRFDWVHSVDRIKIAQRLSAQRPTELPPLNICLQVNIDNQASKSGFFEQQVIDAARQISQLPNLRLRGLMAIPEAQSEYHRQRQPFARLRLLMDTLNSELDNLPKLDTLSMGMSGDLEAAIAEGATIVRVGTDIFGPRN